MRKQIGKLAWWLPVINAVIVGVILWLVNDLNLGAVLTDEAMIALFVLAYTFIILRIPIEDNAAGTSSAPTEEQDDVTQATVIADTAWRPEKPRAFLGYRYPAGTRHKPDRP